MTIRPQDVLLYGGGECFQRFGVPFMRMTRSQDVAATFTRSGAVGPFVDKDGVLRQASANRLRAEWVDTDGDGSRDTPTVLIEATLTNLVLQSEDLSTTWTNIGSPTLGAAHTASGINLDLLGDDDGATNAEAKAQTVTFTGDGQKAISVHVKEGLSPNANGSEIVLRDTTALANRLQALVTWTDGVPSVAMTTGTELRPPEAMADGVYRLCFLTSSLTAANTNSLRLYAGRTAAPTETGDIYVGGVQAENTVVVTSYIATTTGTVSRPVETMYADYLAAPQSQTIYVKAVERGTASLSSGGLLFIGDANNSTDPRLSINQAAGAGRYQFVFDNGTASASATLGAGAAVSLGDVFEIRATLNSDGSVVIGVSIAEGAETTVSASAPTGGLTDAGSAWANTRAYIGSRGSSNQGVNPIVAVKIAKGTKTMAEMRSLFAYDAARAVQ